MRRRDVVERIGFVDRNLELAGHDTVPQVSAHLDQNLAHLLDRGIRVFTAPARIGVGEVREDAGWQGFTDVPVVLPAEVTINAVGRVDDAGVALAGEVTKAVPSGQVKGRGELVLRFTSIRVPGGTRSIAVPYARSARSGAENDAKTIAMPAAGGAIVGAIVGGKKGALVGGAIGETHDAGGEGERLLEDVVQA